MRWIVFLVGLLVAVSAAAQPKLLQAHGPSFIGPGDVQSGAAFFVGVRGYSGTFAAPGTGKAFNVREAAGNTTSDIVILSNGPLDIASYNTFVGTDATASCSTVGTAMTCTGAVGTIHVNDPVTGVGITNPCVVTVTNGSTTATVSLAGKATATTCGTVGVAENVMFQVAGFLPKAYDQSGNINDLSQSTAGTQLQFLPDCGDGLPCILSANGSSRFFSGATIASSSLTYMSMVINRVDIPIAFPFAMGQTDVALATSANQLDWNSTNANQIRIFSSSGFTATVNDNSWHSVQGLIAGASPNSIISSDCTQTTGTSATGIAYTKINILSDLNNGVGGDHQVNAYMHEAGAWTATPSTATLTAQSHNIRLYYGTPGAC